MHSLIIHNNQLTLSQDIANIFGAKALKHNTHYRATIVKKNIDLMPLRNKFKTDINYLPFNFKAKNFKLFMSDMDSTLINIECIDEIADFAGIKEQVSQITEQAMNGTIDFNMSLKKRVALLKGVNVAVLDEIYNKRLKINTGGKKLINFLHKNSIITALVSGGFDFFSRKITNNLSLNHHLSNTLVIKDSKLTGTLVGNIINAQAKADFMLKLCKKYNITTQQVISCGDGANDLQMMQISGLSVAYHAKNSVNDKADIIIKFGGLDTIIDLLI